MKNMLSMQEVIDLLQYLGASKITQPKGNKIQFTCMVHGEKNPSAGINIDYVPQGSPDHIQIAHCFSCGFSGTIPKLVLKSLPDQFKTYGDVYKFLKDRYGVEYKYRYDPKTKTIKMYEDFFNDVPEPRHEESMSSLAPFKSGKSTFQYFFDRGFERNDVKDYMIGRDLEEQTVTIPVFWGDSKLAGVIGRYIDQGRPKNMRYRVYDFPKSELLFPLDKLKVIDNTLILVEGVFDAMMLRKWGHVNAAALMGNSLSKSQAGMIADMCQKVITLFDNDSGGEAARDTVEKMLSKKVIIHHPAWYPEQGKDPCECNVNNLRKRG